MDGSTREAPFHTQETDLLELPALGMVGRSLPMQSLRRQLLRLAPFQAPVLVTGDTGTGKELAARALHDASPRSSGPFVTLNAGALCASLIASELFGHERGSFTGAAARHHGVFEQAHKGTLFIDEIAELPLDLQAWLLRALEIGEVRPLGSERVRHVDVRVIAATNADLEELVRARRFRADLYWRLAVLTLRTPALRDRPDDLKTLSEHFLASFRLGELRHLGTDAIQALALHGWPGNVRELRAVLLRAVASSTGTTLTAADVVRAIDARIDAVASTNEHNVETAMLAARGNLSKAARLLRLPRSTLRDRMRADAARKSAAH
ncbi:MAG: sigma-54 dependent transcriptional regulator [Candidatus Uhrbacteria bacterium]